MLRELWDDVAAFMFDHPALFAADLLLALALVGVLTRLGFYDWWLS